MSKLQSLLDLEYVLEFHQSLINGRIISILDQNPIRNYHASLPFLINLLHQPNEEEVIAIDKINQILDPDKIINDRKKVVLMWNRFMRFDVFELIEYNAVELNLTITNFLNYFNKLFYKIFPFDAFISPEFDIRQGFSHSIYFCLMPQKLVQPLDPIIYPVEEYEDAPEELDNGSYNSIEGSSGFYFPNKTIIRPVRSDERDFQTGDYLTSKQLSDFIGFFQPPPESNINDMIHSTSELNMIELKFHKNKYDHIWHYSFCLQFELNSNKHCMNRNTLYHNILQIINRSMENFGYKIWQRNSSKFKLGTFKFYIKADAEIVIDWTRSIPIQVHSCLDYMFENFKNGSSWDSKLPFLNAYSRLFRACIAFNSYSGFLTDGLMILYIKYELNDEAPMKWNHYGRFLYWNLPCKIYEVKSILEFMNCIHDSAHSMNEKPIREVVAKFYSEIKPPYFRICETYYTKLQTTLEHLECKLNSDTPSTMEATTTGISEKYFNVLKQIHSFFGERWVPMSLNHFLNKYSIECVLGGNQIFKNNGVVLKVRLMDKTYVVKIYDPIYTLSIIRQNFQYAETIRDCTTSFIKECCAYAVLQHQDFVPNVMQIGTLISDKIERTNDILAEEPENINLNGFYIIMEYIESKYLSDICDYREKKLCLQAINTGLKRVHDCGISHGDIFNQNILIKNSGKYNDSKVCFIDFGFCKFSKLQTLFPNICTKDDSFKDSTDRDDARVANIFNLDQGDDKKGRRFSRLNEF
ncbi:hypothetical protein DFJ63DRAFT_27569 [Scheffersomyces coipomensis]|uniref:uncharacterized protein n=1 Tax=Scheffersomyces coipomensis TaxID=1788519 RepID=UPI00315DF3AC